MTYNQDEYIRSCLEGFVMQKTNFPFVAVIHDDASTDNTASIILEYASKYPAIIKPYIEKENQWSKHDGSLGRIMDSLTTHSKYIAFCEGDDYWTDPYKLQKQVDLLESDENIKLVYTSYECVGHNGDTIKRKGYEANMRMSSSGDVLSKLFLRNFIQTCSVCMRTDIFTSEVMKGCPSKYDYAYFLASACSGDMAYIPQKTCAYRKGNGSITITQNKEVNKGLWEAYKYFVRYFYTGNTKKISKREQLATRCHILTRYLSHKGEIHELFKNDPWIFVCIPAAYWLLISQKIRNYYYYLIDKRD